MLELKFEDFVRNHEKEEKKILNFLNIRKINNNFDIKKTSTTYLRQKMSYLILSKIILKKIIKIFTVVNFINKF